MAKVIVTGSAGFIGSTLAHHLLDRGDEVIGIDNLNSYYDPTLKLARLARLEAREGFSSHRVDLTDRDRISGIFASAAPDLVVNLAAQAGVRYSLESPETYVDSNVVGFLNILEACRAIKPRHLVFASTSSAYGANGKMPFSPHESANHPLTLYAATKLANESMAHAYAHLFGVPATGLRFFTVYGPWGRPDMALFKFTAAILKGEPIDVYGEGRMQRDFTYVDDIVSGIMAALDNPPSIDPAWDPMQPDPATSGVAPWRILNIGASQPVELMTYISVLEARLGRKAILNMMPMQPGDVVRTSADISDIQALGYAPTTNVELGIGKFVDWYLDYYRPNTL
ncbi:MAG: capsular biosynthesis protein CpsI [Alphaproteobacteria bacterium PA2]|nr:MAG: capsular biosynthesis protein CpsI [Alphaproteobacteria bacterium PA2]